MPSVAPTAVTFGLTDRHRYPLSDSVSDLRRESQYVVRDEAEPVSRAEPIFFDVAPDVVDRDAEFAARFERQPTLSMGPCFALNLPGASVLSNGFFVADKAGDIVTESFRAFGQLERFGFTDAGPRKLTHSELNMTSSVNSAAVIGIQTNVNFFHWICEALPRLWLLEHLDLLSRVTVLVPPLKPWMADLMRLCTDVPFQMLSHGGGVTKTQNLVMPARGLSSIQTFNWHSLKTLDRLRSAAVGTGPRAKRFFLSRSRMASRRMINEDQIADIATEYGFHVIHPESMGVAEQICAFRDAEIIAGPFGAGLANIGFLPPGATVVEFVPEQRGGDMCLFANLAHLRDLRYASVVGRVESRDDRAIDRRDFSIPAHLARNAFESAIESL